MIVSRTSFVRTAAAALVVAALAACGGADTAAEKVDTTGVTAVGSGTGAGDSARAATGAGMDTTTRDSVLGAAAAAIAGDSANRRPGSGTGTSTRP